MTARGVPHHVVNPTAGMRREEVPPGRYMVMREVSLSLHPSPMVLKELGAVIQLGRQLQRGTVVEILECIPGEMTTAPELVVRLVDGTMGRVAATVTPLRGFLKPLP